MMFWAHLSSTVMGLVRLGYALPYHQLAKHDSRRARTDVPRSRCSEPDPDGESGPGTTDVIICDYNCIGVSVSARRVGERVAPILLQGETAAV
ncbi:hypothetical protein H4582DRAFT_671898 [Lactarius indigo]|nr:hypothetical protein H4582DRAFT_671898 [Lactarius indigo]